MKTITLIFDGYWRRISEDMPESSGLYCVYRGKCNGETVSLKKLIYIGEAKNVKERIQEHISNQDWIDCLKDKECILFSIANVDSADRERAEAAMIYYYKPQFNNQHKYNYGDYAATTIVTRGENALIEDSFKVE